jgi:hypothetical protein
MFQLLNYIVIFITIISTVKMIFLSNKKVKKDVINPNTTSIYSKEKLNQVSIVTAIDNTSYYFDIDNCVDELQLTHISQKIYVYA